MSLRFAGRGFTLIEIVVAVAIIGLLASAAFPVARIVSQRAKESELRIALRQIRTALDAYKQAADEGRIERRIDETGYPRTLEDLVIGQPDRKSPDKTKIYFLRRLPRDPMYPDASVSPAATWGTRSYASAPDDPQPGNDVFDIFSLSPRNGLNGVPYREW